MVLECVANPKSLKKAESGRIKKRIAESTYPIPLGEPGRVERYSWVSLIQCRSCRTPVISACCTGLRRILKLRAPDCPPPSRLIQAYTGGDGVGQPGNTPNMGTAGCGGGEWTAQWGGYTRCNCPTSERGRTRGCRPRGVVTRE